MKPLAIVYMVLLSIPSYGLNYIDYQRTINRIDEDVLVQNYNLAIQRLDSIYANYDFVYARHCMKALQICVSANDSTTADKWLEKCFKQGIPLWIIRTNELTKMTFTYSTTRKTFSNFDSLRSIYLSSIDTQLAKTIDSLLVIDQKYTQRLNNGFVLMKPIYWLQWGRYNQKQFKVLKHIIETYGYPDEKLIGLPFIQDSASFAAHFVFWGANELRDAKVQIMLQHCYSTWHKIDFEFRDTLYHNLCNGNMPAFQYALIMDFMLPEKHKYIQDVYWPWHGLNEQQDTITINANRYAIGMNSLEQENRNTQIKRERRKKRRENEEIVLE